MNEETAQQIAERIQHASGKCSASLRTVMSNDSLGQAKVYGRLVGDFMGHAYGNVLGPIWRQFPTLEPAAMRQPYAKPLPALSEDSQRALGDFLAEAKSALAFTRAALAADETKEALAPAGLSELEEAIARIEDFLRNPRFQG